MKCENLVYPSALITALLCASYYGALFLNILSTFILALQLCDCAWMYARNLNSEFPTSNTAQKCECPPESDRVRVS